MVRQKCSGIRRSYLVLFLMLQLSNLCMSAKQILIMKLVAQEMTLAIIFPLRIRFIAN